MKRLCSIMQAENRETKKTEQKSHQHRRHANPPARFAFRPQETTAKQTREGARAQKTPTQEPPDTGGSPSVS